jgi:exodeoxyribonuclease V alpha subunit
MSEMTETDASTVHSILQWDLETNTFGKDENNPLEADILIVDEFSMVDIWLFYNLLKASVNVRKIILIGDENQLPSVGPGCVLRDLTASSLFPVSRLETIYRQKEGSDVIALAHDILHDETDLDKYRNEVAFLECDYKDLRNRIVFIVQNALDKGYDIDDIQVLSPMYSGNAGIDVLNNTLQAAFNPPDPFKKEIRIGYTRFREGDKILQLKNQPDDDVYNGDIGILAEILEADETDTGKKTLVVDFNGIIVEYTQETWNHITLAYCISVHKSQGSEYPIVVMPFTAQHTVMLQRKLIYTAVTRARKALVMLGDKQAFLKGISTMERHVRNTTLRQRLGKMMQSPDPFADLTDYE